MKSRPRLLTTLLINIIVSALVAWAVIYFYDRSHRQECPTTLPNASTVSPDLENGTVNISGVIGVGAITDERLVIQNGGAQESVLTGWYLSDNKGLAYTFPQLMLSPGASVQVHTTSGKDTPTDLYWGRASPAWSSGELVTLYDAQNIPRAFYRVP
jgi:Lamin Tail Domain